MLHNSHSITVIVDNININFKEQNNTNFKVSTNDFSLGISIINLKNDRFKDFYIIDSKGALLFEISPDRN